MTESISDIVNEIERHKGIFDPSREEYLDWVFRYSCRMLECYGLNPTAHPEKLNNVIREYTMMTLQTVKKNYWEDGKPYTIYIPAVEAIDDCLDYDIKYHERKTLL